MDRQYREKWLLFSVTHRNNSWEPLVNPPEKNVLNIFLTIIKQKPSFQLRENYSALSERARGPPEKTFQMLGEKQNITRK